MNVMKGGEREREMDPKKKKFTNERMNVMKGRGRERWIQNK
jgi:hypothetical protein